MLLPVTRMGISQNRKTKKLSPTKTMILITVNMGRRPTTNFNQHGMTGWGLDGVVSILGEVQSTEFRRIAQPALNSGLCGG